MSPCEYTLGTTTNLWKSWGNWQEEHIWAALLSWLARQEMSIQLECECINRGTNKDMWPIDSIEIQTVT